MRLSELERTWFATRTDNANEKLNDMKRQYFGNKVGDANGNTPIDELEKKWLQSVAGVSSDDFSVLWSEVNAASSYPVSNYMDENKRTFYTLETGTP